MAEIYSGQSESDFLARSYSRYQAMRRRFAKAAGELPFTVDEYREWLIDRLGGIQGATRCEYCGHYINFQTMEGDHRMPPGRGGSLGLENLAPACSPCNQQKGVMRPTAFLALRRFLDNRLDSDDIGTSPIDEVDRTDVLGRLQIALKLAKKEAWQGKQARRKRELNELEAAYEERAG